MGDNYIYLLKSCFATLQLAGGSLDKQSLYASDSFNICFWFKMEQYVVEQNFSMNLTSLWLISKNFVEPLGCGLFSVSKSKSQRSKRKNFQIKHRPVFRQSEKFRTYIMSYHSPDPHSFEEQRKSNKIIS